MKPKVAVLGVAQREANYIYVPLLGMQGFWLHEEETKGTGAWDDIIRILTEFYVQAHATADPSDLSRPTSQ